jgi:hypothetical protein
MRFLSVFICVICGVIFIIGPSCASYTGPSELNIADIGFVGNVGNVGSEVKNKDTSYKSDVSDVRYLSVKGSTANITIWSGFCGVKSNISR